MTITINPRRIPRETLQSLVNIYIDQLYAELDEAHATIARLSEENEGLKAANTASHDRDEHKRDRFSHAEEAE